MMRASLCLSLVLLGSVPALAQLNGQDIKGDAGLKSGSQAPPGAYFAILGAFPLKPIHLP